jgi:hypothetical protein
MPKRVGAASRKNPAHSGAGIAARLCQGVPGPAAGCPWSMHERAGIALLLVAQYNKTPLDQVVMSDMRAYLPRISAG